MIKYDENKVQEYLDYFEAETNKDPFKKYFAKYPGNSIYNKFIKKARAKGIADVAIQAGLYKIEKDQTVGNKKDRWSVEEILSQLEKDFKKSSAESKIQDKTQFNKIAKKIYNDIYVIDQAEIKQEFYKGLKKLELKNKTMIHEFSKDELKDIKETIQAAWNIFDTAVKHGFKGKLNKNDMTDLINSLSRELVKIDDDYNIPDIGKIEQNLEKLVKQKILWEEPEKEIKKPSDLNSYFVQLEKGRNKQEKIVGKFKKKTKEYKNGKAAVPRSEPQQYKALLHKAAEEMISKGSAGEIKEINDMSERISKKKLSTGRTVSTYLQKSEGHSDVISNIAADLEEKFKSKKREI